MPLHGDEKRKYQREWYARRRADYFAGKVCVDCGTNEQLELDHVDRATKVSHNIWSWSADRREAELAKCEPRCHDCHEAKTSRESMTTEHGLNMYKRHGCRCPICRKAQSVKNAQRDRRRKTTPL